MTSGQIMLVGMFGIFGVLALAFGGWHLKKNIRLLRSGSRTMATVVGHEREEGWDQERTMTTYSYFPIIEFEDRSGRKQRVRLESGSDRVVYAESYPVPIIYDAADPSGARIALFSQMWLFFVVLPFVIGSILLCVAIAVWVFDIPVTMN